MKEISVSELNTKISEKENLFILDVREHYEREEASIGGELIPLAEVPQNIKKIPKNIPVVVYCKSGRRSANIIDFLEKQHGFNNLFNLKGGITEWLKFFDVK